MKRHSESFFTSFALALLLALTLFYGCRAFDPEPVIVNRPPNTFIIGAPAETTGTRFLRHMYWYGADSDGEVIRYIYAITDSTVQDNRTDEDEEDARFNPATDVTTLEQESWRVVGYTAKTDSVFLFTVDRGATPSKDITFHIVAVDDRGAIDPTPARLHFFNNSLGNPTLKFSVYTEESVNGQPTWVLRWVGTAGDRGGPILGESWELSAEPFVGFSRRFRIDWEASSPNGEILGYRFKANQNANAPYTPPVAFGGMKRWDPTLRSFTFENDTPPDALPNCTIIEATRELSEDSFCDPEKVRWPSDRYTLLVEAQDEALVESEQSLGELRFNVNYRPETSITRDANWPLARWVVPGSPTDVLQSRVIADGDTIPQGSYLVVHATGFDRTPDTVAPDTYGPFCCDAPLVTSEVQYQARYRAYKDDKNTTTETASLFSFPYPNPDVVGVGEPDTIGVNVGPMQYDFFVRAVDEHRRSDDTPDTLRFYGGFRPRLLSTVPSNGDTLLLRFPSFGTWPGSLPYVASPLPVQRWWNGIEFVDADPCAGITDPVERQQCQTANPLFDGNWFSFYPRFEGRPHPEEELLSSIRAWSFSQYTDNDPLNVIVDGPESEDLSFFYVPQGPPNVWQFNEAEAFKLFVPSRFWFFTVLFDPDSPNIAERRIGEWLARRLGPATLRLQGRTTIPGETWPVYPHVRPDDSDTPARTSIAKSGRRTYEREVRWYLYLGTGAFGTTKPTRVWPDFDVSEYPKR